MLEKPFSLDGRIILITGASSGIGRSVAQTCAQAGATCIITARNQKRLSDTLKSLTGDEHTSVMADLTSFDDIKKMVSELPKLDGVVLCAGVIDTVLFKFSDEEEMERMFGTNTFSSIRLLRELVQNKRLNKNSSLIIISSISGVRCGAVGGTLYGASKGALEGFSKALALELAPQKIRVNTICPGMVESNLFDNSDISKEQFESDKQKYPMKRYGKPEEIGYATVYLLSDASQWITGTSLLIDGGYTLN